MTSPLFTVMLAGKQAVDEARIGIRSCISHKGTDFFRAWWETGEVVRCAANERASVRRFARLDTRGFHFSEREAVDWIRRPRSIFDFGESWKADRLKGPVSLNLAIDVPTCNRLCPCWPWCSACDPVAQGFLLRHRNRSARRHFALAGMRYSTRELCGRSGVDSLIEAHSAHFGITAVAGDTAGKEDWPNRLFKRRGLGWRDWFGRRCAYGCADTDTRKTTQCSGGTPEIPSLEHGLKVYRSVSNVLCHCLHL